MPGPPDNWWGRFFLGATAYREAFNKQHMIIHGRPPPDTPAGKRLDEANAKKQELLTNPPPVHGNARWLTCAQAQQISDEVQRNAPAVNVTKAILFLGQYWCPQAKQECGVISPRGPGHILSVATTRAGKGAAQIIPSLLLYGGSMLVIDPKGENYMITAEHRDKYFGKVYRIDPFGLTKDFDPDPNRLFARYNPIDFIKTDNDAAVLATMLLGSEPQKDPFWYRQAHSLFKAMLRYASLTGGETLTSLRRIYEGDKERDTLLIEMGESENTMVQRGVGAFISSDIKIQASVLSELNSRTAIWDEEPMEKLVSQSDFDFADMKALDGKEPFTIYVILPFDQLSTYGALLRMIVDEFRRAMLRDNRAANIPVVALLDEFPALGKMKSVVDSLGQIAGYGVRFWLIAQGISQLESIYDRTGAATILETCATKSFFGVAGPETAKWLSEIIGNKTVATSIVSTGGGVSGTDGEGNIQGSVNTGESIQLHGVPLVSQQEILTNFGQGSGLQIVFQSGLPPAVGLLRPWYEDSDLRQLGVNLYEQSANGPLVTPDINFPRKMEIYVHGGLFGSYKGREPLKELESGVYDVKPAEVDSDTGEVKSVILDGFPDDKMIIDFAEFHAAMNDKRYEITDLEEAEQIDFSHYQV